MLSQVGAWIYLERHTRIKSVPKELHMNTDILCQFGNLETSSSLDWILWHWHVGFVGAYGPFWGLQRELFLSVLLSVASSYLLNLCSYGLGPWAWTWASFAVLLSFMYLCVSILHICVCYEFVHIVCICDVCVINLCGSMVCIWCGMWCMYFYISIPVYRVCLYVSVICICMWHVYIISICVCVCVTCVCDIYMCMWFLYTNEHAYVCGMCMWHMYMRHACVSMCTYGEYMMYMFISVYSVNAFVYVAWA